MTNPDPKCQYCLGVGVRHNGYFEYPCSCTNDLSSIFMPTERMQEATNIIADLMFSYVNKDEDFPHQFEIDAMRDGLEFLKKYYMGGKYTTKFFERLVDKLTDDE